MQFLARESAEGHGVPAGWTDATAPAPHADEAVDPGESVRRIEFLF
jgi:hypothetical protein